MPPVHIAPYTLFQNAAQALGVVRQARAIPDRFLDNERMMQTYMEKQ